MTRSSSHPVSVWTCTITFIVLLVFVGCGGGGGGSDGVATTVTLTYPSGRIMAQGSYLAGTTTRSGEWREYFDVAGSPLQWRRTYVAGAWDTAKDWREWNADGSIRNDVGDH